MTEQEIALAGLKSLTRMFVEGFLPVPADAIAMHNLAPLLERIAAGTHVVVPVAGLKDVERKLSMMVTNDFDFVDTPLQAVRAMLAARP